MVKPIRSMLSASFRFFSKDDGRPQVAQGLVAMGEPSAGTARCPADPVAILTGVLSLILGLIAIAFPSPMDRVFSVGVNFAWLGLGFAALGLGWRVAARSLAVMIGLVDLGLFIASMRHGSPGWDIILLKTYWSEAPVNNYTMNPNAALGCALIAAGLALSTASREFRWRSTGVTLCGSAAAALGLHALIGFFTGLRTTYGLERLVCAALPTAVGLILLGVGVLAVCWRKNHYTPEERHSWALVLIGMTGVVTSISLWQALSSMEKLHLESARQLGSALAGAVLIFGLLATALLGAAVHLAQRARVRMSLAESLRMKAEKEAAEWKLAEQNLARLNAYNRSLIEASLDALVTIDPEGKITDANEATVMLTGAPRDQLIGTDFCDYFVDSAKARVGYLQVFQGGRVHDCELEIRHRDGHTTPVLYNASVYRDEGGRVAGVCAAARVITCHKQVEKEGRSLNAELEQPVQRRTAELQAANQQLEACAYSVSHDTPAPLSGVDGVSQILMGDRGAKLLPEAPHQLDLVPQSPLHKANLTEHLLTRSRLDRQALKRKSVVIADIVRQSMEDLRAEREGRSVVFVIGALPACEGDPLLLRQVFVNLLSNALKYTRRQERARIEIGAVKFGQLAREFKDKSPGRMPREMLDPDCHVYYVRDNGVGFDMRNADKLFGVFQRLHGEEDIEGAGERLATVQQIIHEHGGHVWAEAEVDKGATFYFTVGQSGETTAGASEGVV
jgi:PAS domain S-box-containing protein